MYDNSISNSIIYNKFKKFQNRFTKFDNSYFYTPTIKEKSKNIKNTEKTKDSNWGKLSIGLMFFGFGLLFLSKGVQKNSKKLLENLKDNLENKINKSFLDKKSQKITLYEYLVHKLNSFIKKTESINNINSLKDILFMKLMYKTSPTKKIHRAISNFFEYLSRNTVKNSYNKTQKQFNVMYEKFDKLDNYLLKHKGNETVEYDGEKTTIKELIEQAKDNRDNVRLLVNAFMLNSTQQVRYQYIKDSTSKLYTKFWDESFKGFWTKNNKFRKKEMWQTFIASEQIKANKTDLATNVAFARNLLSYTDSEMKSYISSYIDNINNLIHAKDIKSLSIMKQLKNYIKDSMPLEFNKDNFLKEIKNLEEHTNQNLLDEKIEESVKNDIETNIHLIKKIINEEAPGDLQKMIDIYNKIAPSELLKSGALESAKKSVELFDKSVKYEIDDLFDKLRDLEIGSAPTDILTILFSTGAIVYALIKSKNSTEKSSIILTSGIPILGAILTTLISTTKLISGSKSIVFGLVSGIILNRLGVLADNMKRKSQKNNFARN